MRPIVWSATLAGLLFGSICWGWPGCGGGNTPPANPFAPADGATAPGGQVQGQGQGQGEGQGEQPVPVPGAGFVIVPSETINIIQQQQQPQQQADQQQAKEDKKTAPAKAAATGGGGGMGSGSYGSGGGSSSSSSSGGGKGPGTGGPMTFAANGVDLPKGDDPYVKAQREVGAAVGGRPVDSVLTLPPTQLVYNETAPMLQAPPAAIANPGAMGAGGNGGSGSMGAGSGDGERRNAGALHRRGASPRGRLLAASKQTRSGEWRPQPGSLNVGSTAAGSWIVARHRVPGRAFSAANTRGPVTWGAGRPAGGSESATEEAVPPAALWTGGHHH